MRNGIYSVTFTTSDGVMGNGVCLIAGDQYVGTDLTQSYQGEIHRYDGTVIVHMRIQRHPHLETVDLKLPRLFSLTWSGTAYDDGFDLEARFEHTGDSIRATGRALDLPDGRGVDAARPSYLDAARERSHPLTPAARDGVGR
ncbi:MAG: hypothetical protein J0H69_04980 [Burkholderiales bacterium]|jgi:hypothetical protein|nr:hypothetical protein [Burkholderiales bacterium]